MGIIVSKFGGTSLANVEQVGKALAIVRANPERQFVVVSAPGKRSSTDRKITDLFYAWHEDHRLKLPDSTREIRRIISERYLEISRGLGLELDLETELEAISQKIEAGASKDFAASRGEYLMGKILAAALGYTFVDPADCINFDKNERYVQDDALLHGMLQGKKAVIPGFYGCLPDGSIKTFSRGGSDITGAIVARAVSASLYENWTDVPGLLMADPRVVTKPRTIAILTYREMRELAYMGATVLHDEAMFPAQQAGIPTNIRNTNEPTHDGTLIVADIGDQKKASAITGIAGSEGFTVITVEKMMMNQQVGYARRILTVLEAHGINFEHMPTGIDTLSIIIASKQLVGKIDTIRKEIQTECEPDSLEIFEDMAMIAVVGSGMVHHPGNAARIFTALAANGINVRMINQGSSELNVIIGVENGDYENAVRAIYGEFVK